MVSYVKFSYKKCLDKSGNFHTGKAKAHLRSIGLPEELVPYVKEHKKVPLEPTDTPKKEMTPLSEAGRKPFKKKAEKVRPEEIVGFVEVCRFASRRCAACRSLIRNVAGNKSTITRVNPKSSMSREFGCRKNPFKVSLASGCRKFKRM